MIKSDFDKGECSVGGSLVDFTGDLLLCIFSIYTKAATGTDKEKFLRSLEIMIQTIKACESKNGLNVNTVPFLELIKKEK